MSCDYHVSICFSISSSKSDRGSLEPVLEQESVPERESVSELVQSDIKSDHDGSFEILKDGDDVSEGDDDIIEMSFFEDLKVGVVIVVN